jgi:NAD(P)-dependent dehydrogenase (short-subunit alcohol dehydrogenase family)
MTRIDLSQRTILITGALGAISEHLVRKLGEAGALLVLTDARSDQEALLTIESWKIQPSRYIYRQMDVTNSSEVESVINDMMDRFPNLDTVLGHAGGCGLHPFVETSEQDFDRIFKFNYLAQTYLARAVIKHWMRRKVAGHLIFTSSYVALIPHTRIPAYATAKAALEHLVRCLALECAPESIRVNAISPGNVAAGSSLKVFEEDKEYRDFVLRIAPMGKRNSPEAIADAFAFLCSPLANEITGQILRVDYGVSIPKIE